MSVKPSENVFVPSSHSCLGVVVRPQSFDLILDTGSSDLWFATSGCTGCSQDTPVFNPTKSTSFQLGTQRIPLNYGSGSASGLLARDTITMGPFTVNPQVFGVYFPSPPLSFLPHSPSCNLEACSSGTCDKCQGCAAVRRSLANTGRQGKALVIRVISVTGC